MAFVVPEFPSATLTSLMEIAGWLSSFRIVPIPCASAIVAFEGLVRLRENVSFDSFFASPLTVTLTCSTVSPEMNVTVPEPAAKSLSAIVAVPFAVA